MEFYTIGVYNSTENDFLKKIIDNQIDTFCDIRLRRGVRGSKYSFVNSNRLQKKLRELNVKYDHVLGLAPSSEIRKLQQETDEYMGILKRKRTELGKLFIIAYKDRILDKFNFDYFIEKLNEIDAKKIVLFCVEEKVEACHRLLVSDKLKELGYITKHL